MSSVQQRLRRNRRRAPQFFIPELRPQFCFIKSLSETKRYQPAGAEYSIQFPVSSVRDRDGHAMRRNLTMPDAIPPHELEVHKQEIKT
jgi:hypothetical protein